MQNAREKRFRFRALLNFLRRLLRNKPSQLPDDPYAPYADRMAPLRGGPRGRSGAVAVAEPEEDSYRAFPPRG